MENFKDLGLKVNSELVNELEDAYAIRFGYKDKIINSDPNWKPTEKENTRPMMKNPKNKRDFMLAQIKKSMKKILADQRAQDELKIRREKEKSLEDF